MAPPPLKYLRRAFVALFSLQKRILPLKNYALKTSFGDISIVTMVGIKEAIVIIYFEMDGDNMEMTGQESIKEEFRKVMRRPFLHITLERPTIEELEPPSEMIVIEDSSEEDLKTTRGIPVVMDDDEEPERRMKRQREEDRHHEDPSLSNI